MGFPAIFRVVSSACGRVKESWQSQLVANDCGKTRDDAAQLVADECCAPRLCQRVKDLKTQRTRLGKHVGDPLQQKEQQGKNIAVFEVHVTQLCASCLFNIAGIIGTDVQFVVCFSGTTCKGQEILKSCPAGVVRLGLTSIALNAGGHVLQCCPLPDTLVRMAQRAKDESFATRGCTPKPGIKSHQARQILQHSFWCSDHEVVSWVLTQLMRVSVLFASLTEQSELQQMQNEVSHFLLHDSGMASWSAVNRRRMIGKFLVFEGHDVAKHAVARVYESQNMPSVLKRSRCCPSGLSSVSEQVKKLDKFGARFSCHMLFNVGAILASAQACAECFLMGIACPASLKALCLGVQNECCKQDDLLLSLPRCKELLTKKVLKRLCGWLFRGHRWRRITYGENCIRVLKQLGMSSGPAAAYMSCMLSTRRHADTGQATLPLE
eukprot:3818270-Amphidinium_carterae.2